MRMACHAARVLRQRHKADVDGSESDISPEQRKCLESAFEAADKNGDGILSADEYYEIFQTHGLTIGKKVKEIMMYAMRHFSILSSWKPLVLSYIEQLREQRRLNESNVDGVAKYFGYDDREKLPRQPYSR